MPNKGDMVDAIAQEAGITKKQAGIALNTAINCVVETLKQGDNLSIIGFGTFSVGQRSSRTGRNPQTGETLQIPARKVPKFKAGKALRDAVQ